MFKTVPKKSQGRTLKHSKIPFAYTFRASGGIKLMNPRVVWSLIFRFGACVSGSTSLLPAACPHAIQCRCSDGSGS
eukprot:1960011-Amphidinium_carterae.1